MSKSGNVEGSNVGLLGRRTAGYWLTCPLTASMSYCTPDSDFDTVNLQLEVLLYTLYLQLMSKVLGATPIRQLERTCTSPAST